MKPVFAIVLFTVLSSQASASENPVDLTVHIDGAKPSKGQIIATLFGSKEAYMKTPSMELKSTVDETGRATVVYKALQPGEFAVSIVYDKNSNGKLDTGFLGIPKEKIGFSNNAKSSMGPARYDKAKFILTPETNTISISLKKAK